MGSAVTVGIWAFFVALSLWPPVRAGRWGSVVSLLTMAMNEIPSVLLVVFAASMAASALDASFPQPTWPGAVLAGFVGIGLVWLQVRAHSAGESLGAALGLDPARIGTARVWLGGILMPFQRHRRDVERIRNLAYGPDRRAHRLDVYRGRGETVDRPVLIHLHGGGFVQGGRSREGVVLLNQLAAHGWLCLSADYRLRTAGAYPNPLVDTKRVIAWVRDHATEYGADPGRIFLAGASAGGHLAVSAALSRDCANLQPGFADSNTEVAGVVVLYGYLGPRTADPASSPAALIHRDAPPMLFIHGAHDTMVPPAGPRSVAIALREVSRSPVVWVELPHTQHSFDFFGSVRARMTAEAIEVFLERLSDPT